MMTPVRFYRVALIAPLIVPVLLLPLWNDLTAVLLFSLLFGGAQYVLFAAALFIAIGRLGGPEKIQGLVWSAPVLFVPVQLLSTALAFPEFRNFGALSVLAVFVLVLGYGYVLLVELVYTLANRTGRIEHAP